MPDTNIDHLTLHEKFNQLEHLSRDLIQHLEKGFLPKATKLSLLLKKKAQEDDNEEEVKDITVRNQVHVLLDSERYTDQLYRKISAYCESIDRSISEIEKNI